MPLEARHPSSTTFALTSFLGPSHPNILHLFQTSHVPFDGECSLRLAPRRLRLPADVFFQRTVKRDAKSGFEDFERTCVLCFGKGEKVLRGAANGSGDCAPFVEGDTRDETACRGNGSMEPA